MKRWPIYLLPVLGACASDFVEQWEVTKPRLMVAKLTIDGDTEGRTRPRPGETFSIRYFMMSPEKPQASYGFDLATCVGVVLPDGTLACYPPEVLEQLERWIEREFDVKIKLDSLNLPFSVEPYQGDDQLLVTGLVIPELFKELPAEFLVDRIASFGTFCVDGNVERVPGKDVSDPIAELFECVDNEDSGYKTALPFTMSIFVDLGQPGHLNHHPSFDCDDGDPDDACSAGTELHGERIPGAFVLERPEKAVEEGGERVLAWPAWDASEPLPWDDCAAAPESLPRVRAESGEHTVHVRFDASDREPYERTIEVNGVPMTEPSREEPIVSRAITTHGGELSTYASIVARELGDDEAAIDFSYTPPRQQGEDHEEHIPASGRLVRFYFALRDQRGGTDFTTRELCLLPPED